MSSGLETSRDFQVGLQQAWHRQTVIETVITRDHFPIIVPAPLTYTVGDQLREWDGMAVPISADDGLPVGTAFGSSYSLFTPRDAMAYLSEVLGEHVKQAGSLVAPDRLRFDFSHYEAVTPAELRRIEQMANAQVIANSPVTANEMSKQAATEKGAIAFFGDKYGDVVRVLEAGSSLELCGGTL